ISAQSPNTNLDAQPEGITIAAGASVTLTCAPQPTGCLGGASGGAGLIAGPSPLQNAGTIKVDADSGTGASINGLIANTGTIAFENAAKLGGQVVNEGTLSVAAGATVINSGSSCGDTTVFVKNYAGGTIAAAGSGAFQITNYEQGDGTATGTEPIRLPCGSLKYTGDGSSLVRAYGGFNLSGEMREGQSLEISPESANTNAVLQGPFTNNGSIALTCFSACEPGAGAGFNVNDEDFVNAGTFTIAAASGTGAGLGANTEGTITNTGTLQFDQSGGLGGPVTNKGVLNVADEKTATSSGSSCGDTGSSVTNDAGGSINGAGSGMLSVLNYVQGDGITTGTAPVVIPCGSLKYTGSGAGTVQVNGTGTPMTGSLAAGQVLRLMGGVTHAAPFANAGKIVFDQTSSSPEVNVSGGALVNTGTLETTGPSGNNGLVNGSIEQTGSAAAVSVPAGTRLNANNSTLLKAGRLSGGGTLGGSLENTGGTVAPGASPGTLTVTGSYVQGAGGNLEAEIEGTGAAQFDQLVVGGDATLGGTLTLVAAGGYPGSSAVGDSVDFLDYGGSRSGEFATVVAPALPCPRQMGVAYDDTGKQVMADVSGSGQTCGGGGGGG
ncbi:MAG TPA: hypothetical protein VHF26_04565, partial [Trebonia sp.]|nr:hypothetical protein [Trebonia sp.]